LKSLLANDNVKLLSVIEWQCCRVAFTPIDVRRHRPRNGKHIGADIDADDVSGVAEPLFWNAPDDANGSNQHIE
jgi:hypothetical protein